MQMTDFVFMKINLRIAENLPQDYFLANCKLMAVERIWLNENDPAWKCRTGSMYLLVYSIKVVLHTQTTVSFCEALATKKAT
jgi:hypothetical protein